MLKDSLSFLEAEMQQMKELLKAEQGEIDLLLLTLENIYKRLYVKKSDTEGLGYWEKEFGLLSNTSLAEEQRRAQILAKLNGSMAATKEMLENLVRQVLAADSVKITEYPGEYRFVIYVGTRCFVENMEIADAAVDEARPAHLAYKFINTLTRKYRYKFFVGMIGCTRKNFVGFVNTKGLNIDKYRCGLYIGAVGCVRKIMEGLVDTDGLYFDK